MNFCRIWDDSSIALTHAAEVAASTSFISLNSLTHVAIVTRDTPTLAAVRLMFLVSR